MSDTAHERAVKRHADAVDELRKLVATGTTPDDPKRARALLDIIVKAADECAETLAEYVESYEEECKHTTALDEQADELRAMLARSVEDRAALRKRLGMTDAQWSAQGGACDSDFEAPTFVEET